MHLKTYYVDSVEVAMLRARVELGDEAMLVHSRRTAPGEAHLGRYEVVFAVDRPLGAAEADGRAMEEEAAPERMILEPVEAGGGAAPGAASEPALARELRLLAARMDAPPAAETGGPQEIRRALDEVFCFLNEREFDGRHGQALTQAVGVTLTRRRIRQEAGRPFEILGGELRRGLATAPETPAGGLRMVALIGPAGAGKSTAAAKLAIHEGLARRVPTQLVDLDAMRYGASALAPVAELLGIPVERAADAAPLRIAAGMWRTARLLIADTAGYRGGEEAELAHLAEELAPLATLERHLVLPAGLRLGQLRRHWEQYRPFHPTHLLFTRLDEAPTFGPAWSLAHETALPLSWFGDGARLPAPLAPAGPEELTALVMERSPAGLAPLALAAAAATTAAPRTRN